MDSTEFAGLLCSRLCHDLVSPVGAINNGVELIKDPGNADMQEQIIALLSDSAVQTSNKLKFFRIAFGLGGGLGEELTIEEAKVALSALFDGGKISLEWQHQQSTLGKDLIKIILNVALTAGEAILGAGTVTIQLPENVDQESIIIKAKGSRMLLAKSVLEAVEGSLNGGGGDTKSIPMILASKIGQTRGYSLSLTGNEPEEISFAISKSE